MKYRAAFVFAALSVATLSFSIDQDRGNGKDANDRQRPGQSQTKTRYKAYPIDTRSFASQIDGEFVYHERTAENPAELPDFGGVANKLPVGETFGATRATVGASFPGISATGWVPADPDIAVGKNHIIEVVNMRIAWFSKDGTVEFQQDAENFFAGMGAFNFQFDPKCFYDRVHERYVMLFLEKNTGAAVSKLLVAVSDDDDPNGTWYRYRIEAKLTVNSSSYWMDYPGFGYNKDAYVASGNMFGFSGGFAGVQFIVMESAGVMRDAMMEGLFELAEANTNVMLLTADLGYGVFEKFSEQFPKQFLNVGVAEQNMMGVASGLALEGKIIFTYSIGNFPTLRCLEQIRNDACYHELNINIIASGGGFSYGGLGMSHHATEDISIMRALPNLTVIAPCTAGETKHAILELAKRSGTAYLRIDKTKASTEGQIDDFQIGRSITLREGNDITIIVAGGIAEEAISAANKLQTEGINCRVVSMHTIKPIDEAAIISAYKETKGIITLEENNIVGGLGSAVAEVCMDNSCVPKNFIRIGIDDEYSSIVGSQNFLRSYYNIDCMTIVRTCKNMLC